MTSDICNVQHKSKDLPEFVFENNTKKYIIVG